MTSIFAMNSIFNNRNLKNVKYHIDKCLMHTSSNTDTTKLTGYYIDYKAAYISTTPFQKMALAVGSAITSLINPARGDMIAIMGETTGQFALPRMRDKMLSNNEGREILREQPRINSKTVDIERLGSLPDNTLGKVYYNFLIKNKVTPDSRLHVQFVDDVKTAYVMQRYREVHDLVHAMLFQPTNMLGEVTVKWVEGLQTGLPMCVGGALFGAMRLKPKQRLKYIEVNLPWAIKTGLNSDFLMNIYFEKRWDQPIPDLYREFKITLIS